MIVKLKIKDIINSKRAVSSDNGIKVFELIKKNLDEENNIILDFIEIDLLITAFLNAAIGQLYANQKYTSEFLNSHITIENVKQHDVKFFQDVIETAKKYFANKELFDKESDQSFYGKN